MTDPDPIPVPAPPAEFVVSRECEGQRIDVFLARLHPERSRAHFQRAIREGRVTINGRTCRPAEELKTNDLVRVTWPPPEPAFRLRAESIPLDILYEDDDVVVLNKPPGLVVHPARGHWSGTLVHGLLGHDEDSFGDQVDDDMRPGIVHRLDQDTSGVMVVAKNEMARLALSRAFADRQVEKTYLTIVLGEFGATTGEMRNQIGRHPRNRVKMAVVEERGRPAITKYRVLGSNGELSLVEVRIETGRTHQIRVHFAHIHHPVLGDPLYGGRQRSAEPVARRQMLHAWKLSFPHPRTGLARQYMAPVPDDFVHVLTAAGLPLVGRPPEAAGPTPPEDPG